MNKKSVAKLMLVGGFLGVGAALVFSRPAEASFIVHVSGVICKPRNTFYRSYITYSDDSAANIDPSQTQTVVCPLPMHFSIGAKLEYDFNVIDKTTTESVTCHAVAIKSDNTVIFTSPNTSSGNAFTGYKRMTVTFQTAAEDATLRHYAMCDIPRMGSAASSVLGIRLY